jgi:DNA-binding MurR/RpiR family transcriptional regulator
MANAELLASRPAPRRTPPARIGKPQPPPALVAALAREPKLVAKHPALGDFLRTRWADAAFMTAAGMAGATGLPTTTLVRLLALLGYPSFRSFRDAVRYQLRSQ